VDAADINPVQSVQLAAPFCCRLFGALETICYHVVGLCYKVFGLCVVLTVCFCNCVAYQYYKAYLYSQFIVLVIVVMHRFSLFLMFTLFFICFVQGYLSVPLMLGVLFSQCIVYVYLLTFICALAYFDNTIQFNSSISNAAALGSRYMGLAALNKLMVTSSMNLYYALKLRVEYPSNV